MLSAISPEVRTLLPITAIIWATFEVRRALHRRPEGRVAERGSRLALRFSCLLGVVGVVVCKKSLPSAVIGAQTTVAWIGLAFLWSGVGLRIWSFQTLGRYFTFTVQTSQDQPVISAGPYRVIRHPGDAGILLAVIGLGFVINNWASLVVLTAAIAAGLIYRITAEEHALLSDLGGRYQSYAEGRKRLVPFVW
jgi:protein-S-isoprenylcysteine O-methyltransferase Ste14